MREKEGGGDWVHHQTPKQWNKKGREELREKTETAVLFSDSFPKSSNESWSQGCQSEESRVSQ